MGRPRGGLVAWILLGVWSVWLFALQGVLARSATLGAWVPDCGLLLLVSLALRVDAARAARFALVVGAARTALGADPPAAVLFAYLAVAVGAVSLRGLVDAEQPWVKLPFVALATAFVGLWIQLAHQIRLGGGAPSAAPLGAALTTVALAVALGPTLAHLPGLPAFWRRTRG